MTQRQRSRKLNAFTLVELLVVIAIISILAGLLLPALEDALESARTMQCMNGSRQVFLSVTAYQEDWNTYYPREYSGYGTHKLLTEMGYAPQSAFTNQSCPYGPETYTNAAGNIAYSLPINGGFTSYAVNYNLTRGPGVEMPYHGLVYCYHGQQQGSLGRLRRQPTRVAVVICCAYSGPGYNNTIGYGSGYLTTAELQPHQRHQGKLLPWTYFDGHNGYLSREELETRRSNGGGPWTDAEWSFMQLYIVAGMDR